MKIRSLRFFPNRVRDVRLRRIDFGDRVQVEPIRDYSIRIWPALTMWCHKLYGVDQNDHDFCSLGMVFHFLFWSVDIFDFRYRAKPTVPYVEDRKRNYICTVAEYTLEMAKKDKLKFYEDTMAIKDYVPERK